MSVGKSLVIVESPAKAKTINKYLGNQYIVKSSVGHIRDLPRMGDKKSKKKGKSTETGTKESRLVARMGIDPDNGWKANYEIMHEKRDVVSDLRKLAERCDHIYLATDLDREGEAIAWHLKEVIGGDDSRYSRVVFNEITKTAIQNAFSKPGKLDMNQVNAQQVRRFLDRVVGFTLSPLLWEKVARGLSAGRVQSVATKVVVEREREIKAFIPDEFWNIFAYLLKGKDEIKFEAVKLNNQALKMNNKADADNILAILNGARYIVKSQDEKPTSTKPSAPFITSTLQQAASTRLGYPVKKTMRAAQKLYEAGHITYMRTDSTFLSEDSINAVRGYINSNFGKKYLPDNVIKYGNKVNAQEAHEAIRPSNVNLHPSNLSGLDNDAEKLYKLIWEQFVSCQMTPAQYLSTSILVDANGVELKAKGRVLVFDGFTKVRPVSKEGEEDSILPKVSVGDTLNLKNLEPIQKYTKPPARYTEASLVKELESRGIGRPSTYATIITTIQDRGYVVIENKRLFAKKTGELVTDKLNGSFVQLMDYGFTAGLENTLDQIADGKVQYLNFLNGWWSDFKHQIDVAKSDGPTGMKKVIPMEVNGIKCNLCNRPMALRSGVTGVFLGCSGYTLPDDEGRCKNTMPLKPLESAVKESEGDELKSLLTKKRCSICNSIMDDYIINTSLKLSICSNNPECSGHELETGTFNIPSVAGGGEAIECDKCKGQMNHIVGKFGPYYRCTDATCGNTRRINKDGSIAPPKAFSLPMPDLPVEGKKDHYVLREGNGGLYLAASGYPKIKATRNVKISELISVIDKIPEQFKIFKDAPTVDDMGSETYAMHDRRNNVLYVGTKEHTSTMYYKDGKWT